jgi:hypothetical protein
VTAYDDAIESTGWCGVTTVTFGGSNPLLNGLACDVTIDRAVDDLSETLTNITGTAAAQATITLKGGNSSGTALDLSPFSTNAYSMRTISQYGVGVSVVVTETVWPSGVPNVGSSQVYTLFTGTIDHISLGEDSVTITALDPAGTLQGTANLPAAAGSVANFNSGDTRLNPMAVVDLCMRSAGMYLTRKTWGPDFYNFGAPTLSVPGIGSGLPEIGTFIAGPSTSLRVASPWPTQLPAVDVAQSTSSTNCCVFQTSTPFVESQYVSMEGWFYLSRPGTTTGVIVLGDEDNAREVQLYVNSTGTISLRIGLGAALWTSTGTIPVGPSWVHLFLSLHQVDGVLSINESAWESVLPSSSTSIGGLSQVRLAAPALGVQVINGSASALPSAPPSWTPTFSASLDSQPARIAGLARQSASAWATIQSVAKAYGDVAWFDGAGAFHYETRATWKARRTSAAARTLTDTTGILSGLPEWGAQGVCRSVTANVVTPQVTQSTAALPAWQATETYTVAARTTSTIQIDLDYQLYDLKAMTYGVAAGATSSYFYPVAATSVGDPAATMIGSVTVTVVPNATGLAVTVRNGNPVAISLWEPASNGPYLIVHGKTITFPAPKTLTRAAGATGSDFPMEDNSWRQDTTSTAVWLDDIAQEVAYPQVVWSGLQGVMDPRRSIGDVLSLNDGRHMDVTHPAQIVGTNFNLPAEGLHTLDYTVRTAYPPTGLIVGVSSMTVGSSTMLVRA